MNFPLSQPNRWNIGGVNRSIYETIKKLALPPLTALLFTAAVAAGEPAPIFDGKTFDGWVQYNGTATYRVENGAIVGKTTPGSPNCFLCPKKHYADFELTFEAR